MLELIKSKLKQASSLWQKKTKTSKRHKMKAKEKIQN